MQISVRNVYRKSSKVPGKWKIPLTPCGVHVSPLLLTPYGVHVSPLLLTPYGVHVSPLLLMPHGVHVSPENPGRNG